MKKSKYKTSRQKSKKKTKTQWWDKIKHCYPFWLFY